MNEISQFEVSCTYRENGIYCSSGTLYVMEPGNQMATIAKMSDGPIRCPRCDGRGYILTPAGKQLIEMIWRHLEPRVTELVVELKPNDSEY